ncbi:hypothetical protein [Methylobacterium sp. ID0610]|uniref:hypothetical protein n=1 Tax=Methylobacterium carpenticola TaxID=3344827 RepID=UPI0036842B9C
MTPPPTGWRPDLTLERLTAVLEAELLAAPVAELDCRPGRDTPRARARAAIAEALARAERGGTVPGPPPRPGARQP